MKRFLFAALATLSLCGVLAAVNAKDADPKPGNVLRHVVLFKFKDDLTKEQVNEVVAAFAGLPKKIDLIRDFEWGTDVSVENRSQGFTHAFLVTFADEKGRDAYLKHPAHDDFVRLAGPRIDKVLVVDYRAQR